MEKKTKTPVSFTYTAKLFDFDISESIIDKNKDNPNLNENMIKGFVNFSECLDLYLAMLDITFTKCRIKIFGSVILKNGAILRATNKFHGRPWFSNISVNMNSEEHSEYLSDSGTCYAQVYANYNITLNDCYNKYRR
jgi:hypothetical protein